MRKERCHHLTSGKIPRIRGHRIGIDRNHLPHCQRNGGFIVSASHLVSALLPVDPCGQGMRINQRADAQGEGYELHPVGGKLHLGLPQGNTVQKNLHGNARIAVFRVPVIQSAPHRDGIILVNRIRGHREVADREIVVDEFPNGIQRSVAFLRIAISGQEFRHRCILHRAPTEKSVIVPCRNLLPQGQDRIMKLFLCVRCICTAVWMVGDAIVLRLPDRIQNQCRIAGIDRARQICHAVRIRCGCPTEKPVTRSGRNPTRQGQRSILGLGLRGRRTTAAVCMVGNRPGLCNRLPDRIQNGVRIPVQHPTRRIGNTVPRRSRIPLQKHIAGSGRNRIRKCQRDSVFFGPCGRRTGSTVRLKPNGVGHGLPDGIQGHIGFPVIPCAGAPTRGCRGCAPAPAEKAVAASGRNSG